NMPNQDLLGQRRPVIGLDALVPDHGQRPVKPSSGSRGPRSTTSGYIPMLMAGVYPRPEARPQRVAVTLKMSLLPKRDPLGQSREGSGPGTPPPTPPPPPPP